MLIFTHTVTFSTIIRFKVETQLVSWLQKYDLEMADKQVELDEFTQKYEEEVEKCEKLQVTIVQTNVFIIFFYFSSFFTHLKHGRLISN